jgi:hypothetical protein
MKNTFKIIAMVIVLTLVTIDIASAATGYNGRSGGSRVKKGVDGVEPNPGLVQKDVNSMGTRYFFYDELSEDDENEGVKNLQEKLRSLGFFTFPTSTGYFGPVTLASVKAFQIANGIVFSGTPETTGFGLVGPRTRAALNR